MLFLDLVQIACSALHWFLYGQKHVFPAKNHSIFPCSAEKQIGGACAYVSAETLLSRPLNLQTAAPITGALGVGLIIAPGRKNNAETISASPQDIISFIDSLAGFGMNKTGLSSWLPFDFLLYLQNQNTCKEPLRDRGVSSPAVNAEKDTCMWFVSWFFAWSFHNASGFGLM